MERRMFYLTCVRDDAVWYKTIFEQNVEDDRWSYIQHQGVKNMLVTFGAYVTDAQVDNIFEVLKFPKGKIQIQFG